MSKLAAFLGANSGPILGAGVFAAGALGAGAYLGLLTPQGGAPQISPTEVALPADDAPAPGKDTAEAVVTEPAPVDEPVSEPEVDVVVAPEPEIEVAPDVAAIVPRAPTIDEVRSEADGLTILAGRGEPGADIILFVNDIENTTVQVGNDSAFAIVTFLEVSPNATVLSVVQRLNDVELVASDIILAPRVVARVDTETTETPAATADETDVDANANENEIDETPAQVETAAADSAPVTASEASSNADNLLDVASTTAEGASAAEAAVGNTTDAVIASATTATQNQGEDVAALVDPIDPNPNGTAPDAGGAGETDAVSAETITPEPVTGETATPTPEATTEVAILKSDEDGVQVINRSSAPEVMSNVEIDTISYSEEGDVLLSGRAQEVATSVRVYLNNAPVTILEVDTTGRWRGDLPDVDTGIYTLRVDEVDVDGAVTSRVETPFKREAPEVLAAAAGTADAPAKAITVQKGATLWAIARDRYGDGTLFVRVFEANSDSIKDANLIYPGQVFDLPE